MSRFADRSVAIVVASSVALFVFAWTTAADAVDRAEPVARPRALRHLLYVEVLGNGGLYSVNYDVETRAGLTGRVGFGYAALGASGEGTHVSASMISVPLLLNVLVGGREHAVELGAGTTLFWLSGRARVLFSRFEASEMVPAATATIGYRFRPVKGGVAFRVGATPLLAFLHVPRLLPWGGMSVGGAF